MKILILANSSNGLYRFRKMLLDRLKAKGHEIYCVTPIINYKEELKTICELEDIHIDRRGVNPFLDAKLFFEYLKMIKRIKPDMVLTYTIKPNIYGGLACRLKKIPYAVNITGLGTAFQKNNWLKKLIVWLYKMALKRVKVVFFENQGNREVLIKQKIVDEEKTCALNGAGVDLGLFPYKDLPNLGEEVRFLFIGRIMRGKGVEELFSTIEKLKPIYPNSHFDFIGGFEEDYRNRIEQLESKRLIKYYGAVSNVQEFISNSHCVILPSYHEGMSNALLEAASMGRPLITSNIHGCKEAVIDNQTGMLCEVKDANSLLKAVEKFIKLPFEEKSVMGKKARKHMEENFDKRKVVDTTIQAMFGEAK